VKTAVFCRASTSTEAPRRSRSGRLLPCFDDADRGTPPHVVELLSLSLKLLKLPLSRVLSSMLRLYACLVCLFYFHYFGDPLSVSSC